MYFIVCMYVCVYMMHVRIGMYVCNVMWRTAIYACIGWLHVCRCACMWCNACMCVCMWSGVCVMYVSVCMNARMHCMHVMYVMYVCM